YSTGIGAILGTVSDSVDDVSFGFSANKKFKSSFTIAYGDGSSISTKTITTRAHFMLGLGLSFPADWLTINGKSLEDLVSLDPDTVFLIDLGKTSSVISSTIDTFKSLTKKNAKKTINSIFNLGREVTAEIKGTVTLKFESLTKGFFPDLTL